MNQKIKIGTIVRRREQVIVPAGNIAVLILQKQKVEQKGRAAVIPKEQTKVSVLIKVLLIL